MNKQNNVKIFLEKIPSPNGNRTHDLPEYRLELTPLSFGSLVIGHTNWGYVPKDPHRGGTSYDNKPVSTNYLHRAGITWFESCWSSEFFSKKILKFIYLFNIYLNVYLFDINLKIQINFYNS